MRRSIIFTCLLDLERQEFGKLETCPRDLASVVISAAVAAIPVRHPNQYEACRDWLSTLTPTDRDPGWLRRFAELLLAVRAQGAATVTTTPGIELVWLLQLGYMLAIEINTGLKHEYGSVLGLVRDNGISRKRTKREALADIVAKLHQAWPEYEPSPTFTTALQEQAKSTT